MRKTKGVVSGRPWGETWALEAKLKALTGETKPKLQATAKQLKRIRTIWNALQNFPTVCCLVADTFEKFLDSFSEAEEIEEWKRLFRMLRNIPEGLDAVDMYKEWLHW